MVYSKKKKRKGIGSYVVVLDSQGTQKDERMHSKQVGEKGKVKDNEGECVYWNEYVKEDYIYVLWDTKDQIIQ